MVAEISDRQLEIIGAAGRIMTASGVSGLTIKNLAREMKFSEAAIYRHFTSKEEILVAMLDFLASSLEARYSALPRDAEVEERFRMLFREQFAFFSSYPHFVVAVFSDGLMEESLRINEAIARIMGVKIKYLEPLIREGQARKVFTDAISADEMAHIVMGAVRLQMFKWRTSGFRPDIRKVGQHIIEAVLKLIKK